MRCAASSAFSARKITFNTHFLVNPFVVNISMLYPSKDPENQRFSCVYRVYEIGMSDRNGLQRALILFNIV